MECPSTDVRRSPRCSASRNNPTCNANRPACAYLGLMRQLWIVTEHHILNARQHLIQPLTHRPKARANTGEDVYSSRPIPGRRLP